MRSCAPGLGGVRIDLADNKLGELPKTDRFHFVEGDITINKEWVEYHVKKCDAVVPLVAIANPAQYVTHRCGCSNSTSRPTSTWCATASSTQASHLPLDLRDLRHVARCGAG